MPSGGVALDAADLEAWFSASVFCVGMGSHLVDAETVKSGRFDAVALGMPLEKAPGAIRKGMGDILGAAVIVIVTGAMLGTLAVESGAAQRIADTLVAAFGEKRFWLVKEYFNVSIADFRHRQPAGS